MKCGKTWGHLERELRLVGCSGSYFRALYNSASAVARLVRSTSSFLVRCRTNVFALLLDAFAIAFATTEVVQSLRVTLKCYDGASLRRCTTSSARPLLSIVHWACP